MKDIARFPGGWAFFNFGAAADRAPALPKTANCYECHSTKAAVEQTFVQFYPTLMEVARKMGTVNRSCTDARSPHD